MSQAFRDILWSTFCENEHVHIQSVFPQVYNESTHSMKRYGNRESTFRAIDGLCERNQRFNFVQNASSFLDAVITIYFADTYKVYVCDETSPDEDDKIVHLFFYQYRDHVGKIAYRRIEKADYNVDI